MPRPYDFVEENDPFGSLDRYFKQPTKNAKATDAWCTAVLPYLLEHTLAIQVKLERVLQELRASSAALDLSCVADARELSVPYPEDLQQQERKLVAQGFKYMSRDGGGLATRHALDT